MSWYDQFNAVFFISLATIVVGAFGLSVKYCLKSKCEHLSLCCGIIKIDRRVDLEVQEHIKEMELGGDKDEEKGGVSSEVIQREPEKAH